jgi:hypothetical protein
MIRRIRLSHFCPIFLIAAACGWCHAGKTILRTEHYDVTVEDTDAREVGLLAETLYGELKQFFGAEPHERLNVKVFVDKQAYADALAADGDANGHLGADSGVYSAPSRTAYVLAAGGPDRARAAIEHECTHQFHFLSRTGNRGPRSGFYTEGLAEHFSVRLRDDAAAAAGTRQVISRDRAEEALRDLGENHGGSLRALAVDKKYPGNGSGNPAYGAAWGLVSFLISEHHAEYLKWSAALDASADPVTAWDENFDKQADENLSGEYRRWLEKHRTPWSAPCGGDWQISGRSVSVSCPGAFCMALPKGPAGSLSASVEILDQSATAGVTIGYQSTNDFRIFEVLQSGKIRILTRADGAWVADSTETGMTVRDPRKFNISVSQKDGSVQVSLDGQIALAQKVPQGSRIGLMANEGKATFESVKVE